jgi:toxin ParE1/3/4
MARPRYSPAAARDLEEILDYIARDNPRRARTFVRELRLFCREVATRPRSFPLREELGTGVRLAVYGAYLVLFAEREGVVVIERVVHGARDRKALL